MTAKPQPIRLSITADDEDEDLEEDEEDTPEARYNRGDIDVTEYKDIKATQRVDALYHVTEEVTGIDYSRPDSHPNKTKPMRSIGFIQ
jgi:hypothetical protein